MSTDNPSDETPEGEPASSSPKRRRAVCSYCGGDDITRKLQLGLTTEVGAVGIKYEATGRFLGIALTGTEPLRLDLCNTCGTVVRIYVAETERTWIQVSRTRKRRILEGLRRLRVRLTSYTQPSFGVSAPNQRSVTTFLRV